MPDVERPGWMPPDWKPPQAEATKKRGRKPRLEVPPREEDFSKRDQEEEPEVEVTREIVVNAVVCVFQGLATFVDESFGVLDKDLKLLPHADEAVTQMMPWMKIYGAPLARTVPWVGLVTGLQMLSMRAIDPVAEIIAGVRKPRCVRNGPDDIYTDRWKAAQQRRGAGVSNPSSASHTTVDLKSA